MRNVFTVALLAFVCGAAALDNGLARTPPMGWRSWNAYGPNIHQDLMDNAADMMVDVSRGFSLKDRGYTRVGLDDYYQLCGAGASGSFHNASGYPIIDLSLFPDMKKMTDKAKSLGLHPEWYANNCGCNEHQDVSSWGTPVSGDPKVFDGINHYIGDVQATIDFGFDGIKLDGCGEFRNLSFFAQEFNKTGVPVMMENCHWGGDGPDDGWAGCPFHFFRTSGDINKHWDSFMSNLQSVVKWQPWKNGTVKTGPGCWAYPDMLEVGFLASDAEDRTHFSAWCIVSSPLVLGHNISDQGQTSKIWPIITNEQAINVNQKFAGHPGGLVTSWNLDSDAGADSPTGDHIQYWAKPQPNSTVAILIINNNLLMDHDAKVDLSLVDVHCSLLHPCIVHDIWLDKDLPFKLFGSTFNTGRIPSHDSKFFVVSPA